MGVGYVRRGGARRTGPGLRQHKTKEEKETTKKKMKQQQHKTPSERTASAIET